MRQTVRRQQAVNYSGLRVVGLHGMASFSSFFVPTVFACYFLAGNVLADNFVPKSGIPKNVPGTLWVSIPGYQPFYLTGTIHLSTDQLVGLQLALMRPLLREVQWFATEIQIVDGVLAMARERTGIPEEYFAYQRALSEFVPMEGYDFMRPFFEKNRFRKLCPLCLETGMEAEADRLGIPVHTLDDTDFHDTLLGEHREHYRTWNQLPESMRIGLALKRLDSNTSYQTVERLWGLLEHPLYALGSKLFLHELLFDDTETQQRNIIMLRGILALATNQTGHAMVGFNHLAGSQGLIALFTRMGADIRQVRVLPPQRSPAHNEQSAPGGQQ